MRWWGSSAWLALLGGVVILALLALGVVAAFQKGTRPPPEVGLPGGSTPTPAAPGGVYREGLVGVPTMLNPLLAGSQPDRDLGALLFSGLTRTGADGRIVPDLADSWTIEDDGRRYVFALRDDATWHDGQPFTARDVLFTIRLLQDADFPGESTMADFWRTVNVETPDDATVICTLPRPYAPFLAYTGVGILPSHLLAAVKAGDLPNDPFNLQPVGTGPFKFAGLDPARVEVSLARHDAYYGDRPRLEGLRFRFFPNTPAALRAAAAGEIDGVGYIPPRYFADAGAVRDVNIYGPSLSGYTALFFNLKLPVFAEREVRQGLALAVDRDALVGEALKGRGTPGSSPILPDSWAYTGAGLPQRPFDPERARQTLERAGWRVGASGAREKGGQALAFTLLTDDDPARVAVATLLARQLEAVGGKVTVSARPGGEVAGLVATRRFEAALSGWEGLAGDPDPYQMWHSSQAETGYNFAGYSNPEADEALAQARLTTDPERRKGYYATFLRLFAADVPSIVLYYPQYHFAVAKRVSGVSLDPLNEPSDRFRRIAEWQLAPAP